MSEGQAQDQVKVEWDPEYYEQSMAAIRAWTPRGVDVKLRDLDLSIGSSRLRVGKVWTIHKNATLCCCFNAEYGLSVLLNGELWVQAIKDDERVLTSTPRVFAWALTQEQVNHLEVSEDTIEVSLMDCMPPCLDYLPAGFKNPYLLEQRILPVLVSR